MFAMLSPLLSLLAGGLPKLLDIWQNKNDQKHELAMAQIQMQIQMEMHKAGLQAQQRIEEIRLDEIKVEQAAAENIAQMQADVQQMQAIYEQDKMILSRADTRWVNVNASVRPVLTYMFALELIGLNVAYVIWAWTSGVAFKEAADLIFSETEMIMLMDMVMFWFGDRAFRRFSK